MLEKEMEYFLKSKNSNYSKTKQETEQIIKPLVTRQHFAIWFKDKVILKVI